MLGVAIPVVLTKKRWPTSAGARPALRSASRTAVSPRFTAAAVHASLRCANDVSSLYAASGSARWRPETCTARCSSSRRSTLKCAPAQASRKAAISVSWSA